MKHFKTQDRTNLYFLPLDISAGGGGLGLLNEEEKPGHKNNLLISLSQRIPPQFESVAWAN